MSATGGEVKHSVRLTDKALAQLLSFVYRDQFDADAALTSEVMDETHHIMQQAINLGTPKHTPRRAELKKQLGQSAAVFSAFRVHRQAEHLAGLLTDEHGHRRPFHQWAKEAQPYLNHQNRAWLQTEYNQAISRAHNEADWQRFKQDADLFPNLEWMPSTSITPGADHQPFWGTILPIDHPFWGEHRPGDRWGCKCQLRSTDAAPTAAPSGSALTAMRPAPGLGSAPGSGQLFSSDHPYYPTNCTACPYANLTDKLRALASGKRKDCNSCKTMLKRIEKAGESYTKQVQEMVSDITSKGHTKKPPVVVGQLSDNAINFLSEKGIQAAPDIHLTAARISHALRQVKVERGAAITPKEMANVAKLIERAEVYYDPSHKNLVYITQSNNRTLKIVVQPNYKLKKMGEVNLLITAGVLGKGNENGLIKIE